MLLIFILIQREYSNVIYILIPESYAFEQNFQRDTDLFENQETGDKIQINDTHEILNERRDRLVTISTSTSCPNKDREYIEHQTPKPITRNYQWAVQINGAKKTEWQNSILNHHNPMLKRYKNRQSKNSNCKCDPSFIYAPSMRQLLST